MIEAEGLFPDSLVIDHVALEKAHIINAKLLKNSQSRGNNTKYIINSGIRNITQAHRTGSLHGRAVPIFASGVELV